MDRERENIMSNYMYPTHLDLICDDQQQYSLEFPVDQFPLHDHDGQPLIQQDHAPQVLPPPQWNHYDPSMKPDKTTQPLDSSSNTNVLNINNGIISCNSVTRSSAMEKKIMHKDVERRRRQEMKTLYASLRSLLPHEYLRGKRSISDHMNEATHYIKHLEKKIQDLGDKRETLKRSFVNSKISTTCAEDNYLSSLSSSSSASVAVQQCWPGVEVVVLDQGLKLPLSRVLEVLVKEGFDVVSCTTSSKVNKGSVYTLQCEV